MAISAEKIKRFNQPTLIEVSSDRTLSENDLLGDVIVFTGAPSTDVIVSAPKIDGGVWLMYNGLDAGKKITFGGTCTILNGQSALVMGIGNGFVLYSPSYVNGQVFPTSVDERIVGVGGVWTAAPDSPSSETLSISTDPYVVTSTKSMLQLAFTTPGGLKRVTLPTLASVPLGRRLVFHSTVTVGEIRFGPASGEKMCGVVNGTVRLQPTAPDTDFANVYAVFTRVSDGWQLDVLRGRNTVYATIVMP